MQRYSEAGVGEKRRAQRASAEDHPPAGRRRGYLGADHLYFHAREGRGAVSQYRGGQASVVIRIAWSAFDVSVCADKALRIPLSDSESCHT
jgi:hypothetical protein